MASLDVECQHLLNSVWGDISIDMGIPRSEEMVWGLGLKDWVHFSSSDTVTMILKSLKEKVDAPYPAMYDFLKRLNFPPTFCYLKF